MHCSRIILPDKEGGIHCIHRLFSVKGERIDVCILHTCNSVAKTPRGRKGMGYIQHWVFERQQKYMHMYMID